VNSLLVFDKITAALIDSEPVDGNSRFLIGFTDQMAQMY